MEEVDSPVVMHLEDALEHTPIGLFHYRILLMCGFAFMADALEVNLLSFLSTCAGDEWNLTNTEQAAITGVVFAGIIVGSLFWGIFADKYGRRVTFVLVSGIITLGGFLTGLANSFEILLFIRAIVGFGIGGANIPFDLLAEFLPAKYRGSFLIYIEYFWTIGSMFVTGLAWLFLDKYGWRVLSVLTAIPVAITSFFSIFYLPESPRWLMSIGDSNGAEKVIRKAAATNGFSIRPFILMDETESIDSKTINYLDIVMKPSLRNITLPLWAVWGIFGLTYYGIILFVSRIYSVDNDDGESDKCSFDYSSIFINSLAELGGVTISATLLDKFGRIKMQIVFYILAAISVFLMGFENSSISILVTSIIGRMAVMAASNATWVSTPELYDTKMRTFGHATCVAISKIGAFISPFIVISDISNVGVGIILGVLNAVASIAATRLPETTGEDLGRYKMEKEQSRERLLSKENIVHSPVHKN